MTTHPVQVLLERDENQQGSHPDYFSGSASEMEANAKAWVDDLIAAVFARKMEAGESAITAARSTRSYLAKTLVSTAQFPPRSSDWLALPRWAAHVAALAAANETYGATPTTAALFTLAGEN